MNENAPSQQQLTVPTRPGDDPRCADLATSTAHQRPVGSNVSRRDEVVGAEPGSDSVVGEAPTGSTLELAVPSSSEGEGSGPVSTLEPVVSPLAVHEGAAAASTLEPATAGSGGVGAGRHPVGVYLARLAPSGRRVQRQALERIAGLLAGEHASVWTVAWHELSYAETQAVRAALARDYAPATANRMLAALRGVVEACWRLGWMAGEDARRAADVASVTGSRPATGRALTRGELAALFASCADGRRAGLRDAAVLAVLYAGGLRRSEAAALTVGDIQPDAEASEAVRLVVRSGKGSRARTVWLAAGAAAAVGDWLALRHEQAGDEGLEAHAPLLVAVRRDGQLGRRSLAGAAIRQIVARRAARAGVAVFTPHDLRRTMISELLDAGADLAVVGQLAGHASPATTAAYDRRGERARRDAAGLLHVPYQPATTASPAR